MTGKSYSIRGNLRPTLGSMQASPVNVAQGRPPKPPKQPNRVPSSISMKRYNNKQQG